MITHDPAKLTYTLDTSVPKFIAWKQGVRIFSHLAAYQSADPGVNLVGGGLPEHLSSLHVSQEYFGVFGARALHGRTFKGAEDRPQGPHVVVLSHGFWMRRFGADPKIVGTVLPRAGAPYEILGVLTPDFGLARPAMSICPCRPTPSASTSPTSCGPAVPEHHRGARRPAAVPHHGRVPQGVSVLDGTVGGRLGRAAA